MNAPQAVRRLLSAETVIGVQLQAKPREGYPLERNGFRSLCLVMRLFRPRGMIPWFPVVAGPLTGVTGTSRVLRGCCPANGTRNDVGAGRVGDADDEDGGCSPRAAGVRLFALKLAVEDVDEVRGRHRGVS
jgi:hypothetical protein